MSEGENQRCGKYILRKEEFGSGGFGRVILAEKEEEKENLEKRLYIVKNVLPDKITERNKRNFDNEIKIINYLSHIPNNKFTSIIYDFKKFQDDEEISTDTNAPTPYYAIDYFSKGLLFDYAFLNCLSERQVKVIFRNIILGFQFLHRNGICHLDIKPENIVFDKDFWPVIIDFGLSKKFKDENGQKIFVRPIGGSERYNSPERWIVQEIDGEKADIFSLGAILIFLVTGYAGFITSKADDEYYKLIIERNYNTYWTKIKQENLPRNFKCLYLGMVEPNPAYRTKLEDILRCSWFNEVNNLTKEEEEYIGKQLENIYKERIKTKKEINIEEYVKANNLITRSFTDDENAIFKDKNLKPKKISKDRLEINQSIRINGNFDIVNFMNSLKYKIKSEFGNSFIKAKENLSMEVAFEEIENDDLRKVIGIGDCVMMIELFEYEEGGYLLEFRRTGGRYPHYFHHFLKIQEIITNKIATKNN